MNPHLLICVAYFICLGALCTWGVHRLVLLHWLRHPAPPIDPLQQNKPTVLVQLPVYNEAAVIERLIDAVAHLDWPNLRIQVLDDSTDETSSLAATRIAAWVSQGVQIRHIQRQVRTGYKAGALAEGLACDPSDFIAIFDADFVPPADFLKQMMVSFASPNIGMVQARWGHLNRDQSWLSRIQSMMLDGHFLIEHAARYRTGRFFNFNGTAGIWRRRAIESAGGWSHDTVTEDLDLSYRAQIAGWDFVYRDDVVAPAEVPGSMQAFLTQQHRWAKGTVQTARKLLGPILRAPLPWSVRLEASNHLTMVLAYPFVFSLAILLPVSIPARDALFSEGMAWLDLFAILAATGSITCFYAVALRCGGEHLRRRWWEIPLAMAVGIGCSGGQTLAVVEGLFSNDATFIRTPKQGSSGVPISVPRSRSSRLLITGGMTVYYLSTVLWVIDGDYWSSLPFILLFGTGFAINFLDCCFEIGRTEAVDETGGQPVAK